MQHPRPYVDSDAKIEQVCVFSKPDVAEKLIWRKAVVIAVKNRIFFMMNGTKIMLVMVTFQLHERHY